MLTGQVKRKELTGVEMVRMGQIICMSTAVGFWVNKHFKGYIEFCLFQKFPDLISVNKPTEFSGQIIMVLTMTQ